MQIILQGMMVLLWLIFVPMLLGTAIEVWCQKEIQYRSAYLLGTFFMWAVFQLIAVLAIALQKTLTTVTYIWIFIIGLALIVSVVYLKTVYLKRKEVFLFRRPNIHLLNYQTKIVYILIVLVIGIEIVLYIFGVHKDLDDTRFVANSVVAWNRDRILLTNPQTGANWDGIYGEAQKDAVSPWTIYIALLARLMQIHPTIIAHTVLPVFLLVMSYFAYSLLVGACVKKEPFVQALFLLILCIAILFGRFSVYASATFMLTRIWQGKSCVVAVLLPYLLCWLIRLYDDVQNKRRYVVLALIHTAGCLLSGMGIILCALLSGAQIVSYGIQKRDWKVWLYGLFACIPNLFFALLFLKG